MNPLLTNSNILLITEPSGGGSGRHFIDLSRELAGRGYSVHAVYSPNRAESRFEEELQSIGLSKVTAMPMRREVGPWDLGAAMRLRQFIRTEGPFTVVHAHSSKAGALARIVAPSSIARIYTPHAFRTMDPNIRRGAALIYRSIASRFASRYTDGVIVVSQEEYDHALGLGIARSKLFLVHNGIFPRATPTRQELRQELNIPPEAVVVGFVGRMSQQKDPIRFVQSVLAATEHDSRILGVMIGEGELLQQVVQTAAGRLRILGNRDARLYLPAFDLLAMTSNYEAMPYVLIEALHAGLPIVATKVGGTASTLRTGENGICVPTDATPQTIAAAIVDLVAGDRLVRSAAASRALAERFTARVMADEILAVYETCVRGKSR